MYLISCSPFLSTCTCLDWEATQVHESITSLNGHPLDIDSQTPACSKPNPVSLTENNSRTSHPGPYTSHDTWHHAQIIIIITSFTKMLQMLTVTPHIKTNTSAAGTSAPPPPHLMGRLWRISPGKTAPAHAHRNRPGSARVTWCTVFIGCCAASGLWTPVVSGAHLNTVRFLLI